MKQKLKDYKEKQTNTQNGQNMKRRREIYTDLASLMKSLATIIAQCLWVLIQFSKMVKRLLAYLLLRPNISLNIFVKLLIKKIDNDPIIKQKKNQMYKFVLKEEKFFLILLKKL